MPSNAPALGFTFRAMADGTVRIARHGAHVVTLRGVAARRFISRVQGKDDATQQAEAARATGNYARGTEKTAAGHPRNAHGAR